MPSTEHERFVEMMTSIPRRDDLPLQEQRDNYAAILAANPLPEDVEIRSVEVGAVSADWVDPPGPRRDRVTLYLHGGGYVIGSSTAYHEFGARLAGALDSRVLLLDYRLAPECPFPAAVDDAVAAYRYLLEESAGPGRVVIAGDSAGGGLTLATLARLRDEGEALPAAGICFSPWTDLEATGDSHRPGAVDDPLVQVDGLRQMARLYAEGNLRHPLASPLHADFRGFPPLHVEVGTREVLLDDARRVVEKARRSGVETSSFEAEGLIHVWPVLMAGAPESAESLERVRAFLDRVMPG